MNKKGFVFIETVIVVIVLTSSLLLLYTTFNKTLQSEKTRINYDDVNYIYRTWGVANLINSANITDIMSDLDSSDGFYKIIYEKDKTNPLLNTLFASDDRTIFNSMKDDYEIEEILLFRKNKTDNLKRCYTNCNSSSCSDYSKCTTLKNELSSDFQSYLKNIYVDVDSVYLIIVKYKICNTNDNTICKYYFSWVGV